jgi:hypothetical protein
MNETQAPLPSSKTLLLASLIAIIMAGVVLVAFIWPAEYGIDLTGLGKRFGLIALSEKSRTYPVQAMAIPLPAQNMTNADCPKSLDSALSNESKWQNSVMIMIPPKQGLEYKFHLLKNATLEYAWNSDSAELYFDFHGEPKGDTSGYFKSYQEATDHHAEGQLSVPFEGSHGWYWENKTDQPAIVVLNTQGHYDILGLR